MPQRGKLPNSEALIEEGNRVTINMLIPPERLTMEVLRNLVESYITREGTDYGESELTLDEKVDSLMPSVIMGEVVLVYDESSDSVNLMPKGEFERVGLRG